MDPSQRGGGDANSLPDAIPVGACHPSGVRARAPRTGDVRLGTWQCNQSLDLIPSQTGSHLQGATPGREPYSKSHGLGHSKHYDKWTDGGDTCLGEHVFTHCTRVWRENRVTGEKISKGSCVASRYPLPSLVLHAHGLEPVPKGAENPMESTQKLISLHAEEVKRLEDRLFEINVEKLVLQRSLRDSRKWLATFKAQDQSWKVA